MEGSRLGLENSTAMWCYLHCSESSDLEITPLYGASDTLFYAPHVNAKWWRCLPWVSVLQYSIGVHVGVDFQHRVLTPLFSVTLGNNTAELCYTWPKHQYVELISPTPAPGVNLFSVYTNQL